VSPGVPSKRWSRVKLVLSEALSAPWAI
jgi:hypothetical protein